jgi:hypothetical protein
MGIGLDHYDGASRTRRREVEPAVGKGIDAWRDAQCELHWESRKRPILFVIRAGRAATWNRRVETGDVNRTPGPAVSR